MVKMVDVNELNTVLEKIYVLQSKLNKDYNGPDYLETKVSIRNGKPIEMGCALLDESVELLDNTPWKHWDNNTEVNKLNTVTECIDIMHFIPSIVEQLNYDAKDDLKILVFTENDFNKEVFHYSGDINFNQNVRLLSSLCSVPAALYNMYTITPEPIYRDNLTTIIKSAVSYLFTFLLNEFELTPTDVYKKYLIKNTLNKFRKNNGYAEGTYKKMWFGVEDNDYIYTFIKDMKNIDQDSLYNTMEAIYSSMVLNKD